MKKNKGTSHKNRNLIVAVVQGNITKLDALLKEPGVQIDEPDQVGQTPLMWAVAKKDLDAVKKLIELKSSRIFAPLGASSSLH